MAELEKNYSAAKEWNRREEKTGRHVALPMRILLQREITPIPDAQRSQQWPQKNNRTDQERAMKERFEADSRQPREDAVMGEPSRAPEEQGSSDCTEENRCREVEE